MPTNLFLKFDRLHWCYMAK